MKFSGTTSLFEASFPDAKPGRYELQIIASDAGNVNFAMATREMVVE